MASKPAPVHTAKTATKKLSAEFTDLDLGDSWRDRRARSIVADLMTPPDRSFPETWKNCNELEAAYRFFGNPNGNPTALVNAHAAQTVAPIRGLTCPVVIAHDTTELEMPVYFEDKRRALLAYKSSRTQGFDMHSSIAVALDDIGTPLGSLAGQPFIGKDQVPDARTEKFWPDRGGLYVNEMQRWRDGILRCEALLLGADQEVIHTGDRELGRYNMLAWMDDVELKFVVRAAVDQVRAKGKGKLRLKLPEGMADTPWAGTVKAMIARRSEKRSAKDSKTNPSRQAREAVLSFRAKTLTLARSDRNPGRFWSSGPPLRSRAKGPTACTNIVLSPCG